MERGESRAWSFDSSAASARGEGKRLAPFGETAGQARRQTAIEDLLLRAMDVVIHAAQFDQAVRDVVNRIRGAPVAVPRLSDAADVQKVFPPRFDDDALPSIERAHVVIANVGARHVGVPEETKLVCCS